MKKAYCDFCGREISYWKGSGKLDNYEPPELGGGEMRINFHYPSQFDGQVNCDICDDCFQKILDLKKGDENDRS